MQTRPIATFLVLIGLLFAGMGAYGMTPGRFQPRLLKDMLKHPIRNRIQVREALKSGFYVSQAETAGPYLYLAGAILALAGLILGTVALFFN